MLPESSFFSSCLNRMLSVRRKIQVGRLSALVSREYRQLQVHSEVEAEGVVKGLAANSSLVTSHEIAKADRLLE